MIYLYRMTYFCLILIFQFSIFPRFCNDFLEPDLLLATVIIFGLLKNGESACTAGFMLGLLSDVNGGIILGCNAFAWTQVGMATATISNHLLVDNPMVQTIMTGLCCILAGCFQIVFYRFSAVNEPLTWLLLVTLSRAMVTAVVAWPLSRIMMRIGLVSERRHA